MLLNKDSDDNRYEKKKALIVRKITKHYWKCRALKEMCLSVNNNEVFGILGVNGSGKSTCLRVLTGDERPSSGNASIGDYCLTSNVSQYQRMIGYSPQVGGYIESLSGRAMLQLIAKLRDIDNCKHDVEQILTLLDLKKIADDLILHYSGGNKRKLSVAMALIGIPKVVFLDEPTVGIDIQGKYELWKILMSLNKQTPTSVVLTSHSVKECDVLCDTVSVMAKGRLHFLGYTQTVKCKYSRGFTFTVKTKTESESNSDCNNQIFAKFPSAVFKEKHDTINRYYIPKTINLSLASIFEKCEQIASCCDFEDFEIDDKSLEEIFMSFCRRKLPSYKYKDV
ncbi:ATP-binding cassette sub-family A member 3-like protein [Leptotrombidium deliense]|uniref:ATP-binding cassette sub-family A member 3-like protein n=1 Tax=Leptotrombidium deliense TaxID=299467 RepID=A0A443SNG5_9ACAR|nr:ATP-binding cassette sub-family A member 3-like protein [Leptotrombidium deliense]